MIEDVDDVPGGEMNYRPLHFFWILDCSRSMQGEKIGELNFALREAIPAMRQAAESNPNATLLVRVLTFATGADWHVEQPVEIDQFTWADVAADGVTDLGAALELVAAQLEMPPMPERALPPVLVLVSDGQPTDDWKSGLAKVGHTPWGRRSVRQAIAIGQDADRDVLKTFLANPELEPLTARNSAELVRAIKWASTAAVRVASAPRGDSTADLGAPPAPIPGVADDDDEPW